MFKKTLSYLNSEGITQDEFVGKIVEVASFKLKILRKIAEGEERTKRLFYLKFVFSDLSRVNVGRFF